MPRRAAHEERRNVWQPLREPAWAFRELGGATTSCPQSGRMGKCPILLCKSLSRRPGWMLGVSRRRAAPTRHLHPFSWVPIKLKSRHCFPAVPLRKQLWGALAEVPPYLPAPLTAQLAHTMACSRLLLPDFAASWL